MFVELHMIQNFGPSCLNRDDTNTPKDCQFGGYRRARISSQCFKRAIREYFDEYDSEFKGKLGNRTRLLPKNVIDILMENGKAKEESVDIVKKVFKKLKFKTDNDGLKTEVLLFINNDTPEQIAQVLLDNWNDFTPKTISKSKMKNFDEVMENIRINLDADIALFGRMVASKTDLNVDSACYVAHALSTHKVDMEMDFYTALDDLQEEVDSGAGMMGVVMYNSSCFYRYSVLDYDQLIANLQGNHELALSVLKAYINASINAIPTGKQTSMAAFNKPDFIMATVRTDQPWSLTNAFATPAKIKYQKNDLINQSIEKLGNYLGDMINLYGTPEDLTLNYCVTGERPTKTLEEIAIKNSSIKDLINNIGEDVNGRYTS